MSETPSKSRRLTDPCRIGQALAVFDGRWKGAILWWLQDGPKRFSELRRLIPAVTQRVLTHQLRHLQRDGLVARRQYPEMPVRVEYSMSRLCRSLLPVLDTIAAWGSRHLAQVDRARAQYDER